jgi:phage terminase large subunit-like protein
MKIDYFRPTWTIDEVITDCNVNKKALILIPQMKAVLITDELKYEFMMRINYDPSGHEVNDLLYKMREEQLKTNPMPDQSFMDTYLLNPVQALKQYFKEHIIPYQVERMMKWGVTVEELVKLKQQDSNIRFERAVMNIRFS